MARSEHIDMSHKQPLDPHPIEAYTLENIQKRQQLWTRTCQECDNLFNTQVQFAEFCGLCSTVANVLFVWGVMMAQRWNIIPANPNPIVERVAKTQQKPTGRRLTQNG